LETLEYVRTYSIPISDPRVRYLVTWYLRILQRAVDIIWDSIMWNYRFLRLEERKGKLRIFIPGKLRVLDAS